MAPAVRLDPASGPVGTAVVALATGFAGNAEVQLSLLGGAGAALRVSGATAADGTARVDFTVPGGAALAPGWHGVVTTVTSDAGCQVVMAVFEVSPSPGAGPDPPRPAAAAPAGPAAGPAAPPVAALAGFARVDPCPAESPTQPVPVVPLAPPAREADGPRPIAAAPTANIVRGPPEPVRGQPAQPAQPAPPAREADGPRPIAAAPTTNIVRGPPEPAARRFAAAPPAPARRRRPRLGVLLVTVMLGLALFLVSGLPSGGAQLKVELESSSPAGPGTLSSTNGPSRDPAGTAASAGSSRAAQLGSGQPVTLAFGGDVHFEGVLATRLAANPTTLLSVARPLYAGADLMMINLETAITSGGSAQPKQYLFRAPASALTAVKAAGITLATEANNHGEDYGQEGLADSIEDAREAGLPVIGIGEDADQAFAPYRTTLKGQRIAIIAATQVLDDNLRDAWTATDTQPGVASAYDPTRLLAAVRQARASSDTVVVYLHWGVETQTCPTTDQEQLADQVVAAGADIVVGSHAHVQLGAGYLNGALVDYGLGNFAFYATLPAQVESGVLQVTVTGRRVDRYQWLPAHLSGGVAHPLTGTAASAAQEQWAGLRSCTDLTP